MKKVCICALSLTLLLCGCGRGEEEAARALQSRWAHMASLTTESEITCHLAGESRSFTVVTTCTAEGATTTITAPAELAGLSATVSGEELLLRYEASGKLPESLSARFYTFEYEGDKVYHTDAIPLTPAE